MTLSIFILVIQGCHTYLIDKESAARQMTNLKVERGSGKKSGNIKYSNEWTYLIIKNEKLSFDTILPFDIKFLLKSGINSGWWGTTRLIYKEGYFISYSDTTLKTSPKCKFCNINIDSIEKIEIRGPRKINFASYNDSRWHVDYRMSLTSNFVNKKTKDHLDNYFNLGFGTSIYYRNFIFSYCLNGTTLLRVKKQFKNTNGDSIRPYANTFWKTNGAYSINIIKHNFDFGYEFKINNKISLTPTIGAGLWHFTIKDSANYRKNINSLYDINLGLSLKRFVYVSEGARFFYGLQGYTSYSNVTDNFSSFGNPYWTITINCGFKFVPRGLIALGILDASFR